MTVDAAITGCCDIAESETPVLGVAVSYAVGNVVLTILGPVIVTLIDSAGLTWSCRPHRLQPPLICIGAVGARKQSRNVRLPD